MSRNSIRLEIDNLHWLGDFGQSQDLCSHGDVIFEVNGLPAWNDSPDDLCVSATGLNLLRTIERDHTQTNPLAEHLFPCCGYFWAANEEGVLVNVFDCSFGRDAIVEHRAERVVVTVPSGESAEVRQAEWVELVCRFAAEVSEFTQRAGPKKIHEDDAEWYGLFWQEWEERYARATSV